MSQQATYHLAKALHHANAAAFHIEMTAVESEAKFSAKDFLNKLKSRCESVVKEVRLRIGDDEMKKVLTEDLKDPTTWDALTDIFISLESNKREEMLEFGGFLFDIQAAERIRVTDGGQAHYDERIAPLLHNLEAFIKEEKRRLDMMERQREYILSITK